MIMVVYNRDFDRNTLYSELKENEKKISEKNDEIEVAEIERDEEGDCMYLNLVLHFGDFKTDDEDYITPDFGCYTFNSRNLYLSEDLENLKEEIKERVANANYSETAYDETGLSLIFDRVEKGFAKYLEDGVIPESLSLTEFDMVCSERVYGSEEILSELVREKEVLIKEKDSITKNIEIINTVSNIHIPLLNRYFDGDIYRIDNENQLKCLLSVYITPYEVNSTGETECEELGLENDGIFPKYVFLEKRENEIFNTESDERYPVSMNDVLARAERDVRDASKDRDILESLLAS
jgi:hypothetical protein